MTKDNFDKAKTIRYNIVTIQKDLDFLSRVLNSRDIDFRLNFGISGEILVPTELRKKIIMSVKKNLIEKIKKLEKEFEDL